MRVRKRKWDGRKDWQGQDFNSPLQTNINSPISENRFECIFHVGNRCVNMSKQYVHKGLVKKSQMLLRSILSEGVETLNSQ